MTLPNCLRCKRFSAIFQPLVRYHPASIPAQFARRLLLFNTEITTNVTGRVLARFGNSKNINVRQYLRNVSPRPKWKRSLFFVDEVYIR